MAIDRKDIARIIRSLETDALSGGRIDEVKVTQFGEKPKDEFGHLQLGVKTQRYVVMFRRFRSTTGTGINERRVAQVERDPSRPYGFRLLWSMIA